MRTGRAGPRWGARSLGRGRGNSPLESLTPGGVRGPAWRPLRPTPATGTPSPPAPGFPARLAPCPGAACAARAAPYPAELSGLALRVLEALTCEHWGPRPRPAGNFPDLPASIAVAAAAGWLCVCARVRVCVRLGVRPAGGRAGSAERLLSPAGDAAAVRSCRRLTGGCVAPMLAEPSSLFPRAPQHRRETTTRATAGAGAGDEPVRLGAGPALGHGAVVLNGQLRASQLPARPPPGLRRCCRLGFSALLPRVAATPSGPRLDAEPTPFPTPRLSPGDSCYSHRAQAGDCLR